MRAADSVDTQVAHAWMSQIGKDDYLVPIEFGGRGKVVELWGVHYQVYGLANPIAAMWLFVALNSNPEKRRAGGMAGYDWRSFIEDKAIYGRATWRIATGGEVVTPILVVSQFVPLYGIVRPRKQDLQVNSLGIDPLGELQISCEVYYRPIVLATEVMETIDRVYGKNRRT